MQSITSAARAHWQCRESSPSASLRHPRTRYLVTRQASTDRLPPPSCHFPRSHIRARFLLPESHRCDEYSGKTWKCLTVSGKSKVIASGGNLALHYQDPFSEDKA